VLNAPFLTVAAAQLRTASDQRLEIIGLAIVVCGLVFELVRRKRLMERYAILWLFAVATILLLALWQGLLTQVSHAAGIYYPPSALFAVAFVFVLAMLVHFSITLSRLSDQNKVLAQRVGLLEHELALRPEASPLGETPVDIDVDIDELAPTS
jgi:hypothetical protein